MLSCVAPKCAQRHVFTTAAQARRTIEQGGASFCLGASMKNDKLTAAMQARAHTLRNAWYETRTDQASSTNDGITAARLAHANISSKTMNPSSSRFVRSQRAYGSNLHTRAHGWNEEGIQPRPGDNEGAGFRTVA